MKPMRSAAKLCLKVKNCKTLIMQTKTAVSNRYMDTPENGFLKSPKNFFVTTQNMNQNYEGNLRNYF